MIPLQPTAVPRVFCQALCGRRVEKTHVFPIFWVYSLCCSCSNVFQLVQDNTHHMVRVYTAVCITQCFLSFKLSMYYHGLRTEVFPRGGRHRSSQHLATRASFLVSGNRWPDKCHSSFVAYHHHNRFQRATGLRAAFAKAVPKAMTKSVATLCGEIAQDHADALAGKLHGGGKD